MTIPLVDEIAVVQVDGLGYTNWETVMVQHRYMDPFPVFMFSGIEQAQEPMKLANLLFRPGQHCTITLAGFLVVTGMIEIRQSAMDGERHALQIIGKGFQWQGVKSSVVGQAGGGYDFSGQNIKQVADTIFGETGVKVLEVGNVDHTPFPALTVSSGESVFNVMEWVTKARRVILGGDHLGNILLIGQHSMNRGGDLVEGPNGNVSRINVIISNENLFKNYYATGQNVGTDDLNGEAASQNVAGPVAGPDITSNRMVPLEVPGNMSDVQKRALWEANIKNGTQVNITILVYGWKQKNGDLWRVGDEYIVDAPDHLPEEWNKQPYAAQTVTYQQDDQNGTTTTLELVIPLLLNGNYYNVGSPLPEQSDVPAGADLLSRQPTDL